MKNIEQKVIKFITGKHLIQNNENILVALSGGPDSVFLLYFLYKFQKRFKINKLGAFHLNHKLRGKQADKDQEFCREFCAELKIEFSSVKKNVKLFSSKNKVSIEEGGRIIRYKELENYRKKNSYDKIATAHISDDNTETVLLNLIKGTGIKGISGIPYKRDKIIRPLLGITKEEVLVYLNHYGIKFRTDPTNESIDYERNYLRNEIIPLVKKRLNPNFNQAVFKSSDNFKKIKNILEKDFTEFYKNIFSPGKGKFEINLKKIDSINEDLRDEFLRFAFKKKFKLELNHSDVESLGKLIKSQAGKKIQLTGGLIAVRERNSVDVFHGKESKIIYPIKIKIGESVPLYDETLTIKRSKKDGLLFSKDPKREFISADDLANEFEVRQWKSGDRFYPIGLRGSKKISDFLNEIKIPSFEKKNQLLLTNKGSIVWVIGHRIDGRFKISNNTNKVLELWLK